ncbi:hypothetical protein NL108_000453 [Boleophthalmus pectinirostris]|nr:hypothetical protein NL108_000453 [Boleophthalmus pectinirostris]
MHIIMNMRYSLAPAALFCLTTWITSLHMTSGHETNCCLENRKTKVRLGNIVGYKVQMQGFCPINSVAFLTKEDKWICWDPLEPYAQKTMQRVEELRRAQQQKEVTTIPDTAKNMTISQTMAPLSSINSTQIQTHVHKVMVRTVDSNGKKKNSRRRGKKRKISKQRNNKRM